MSDILKIGLIFLLTLGGFTRTNAAEAPTRNGRSMMEKLEWDYTLRLPDVKEAPNPGVAGAFAGFIGNKLIVAGGANFPQAMPWQGGRKMWCNTTYVLDTEAKDAEWKVKNDFLPFPVAYGVSITLPEGILCIGGCDADRCFDTVFLIQEENNQLTIARDWPSLPVPLANATGALLDHKIYLAGGQESMQQPEATRHFYVLDLAHRAQGWKVLEAWPGEARGYAVSAVQSDGFDNCFYLFSGRNYHTNGHVEVLTDAFAYNPRLQSWSKLDQTFPVMAATATPAGANHILFIGGVAELIDGSDNHPGFDRKIRLYHTITRTLIEKETLPYPVAVTTTLARKGNTFYLASGEIKPGIRTPYLLKGRIVPFEKGLGVLNTVIIILYFSSLAWIGYYFSKKQKNTDDYFKGGGRIPWWAVGLSIFGTGLSAITFMSIPAKAYASDWSYLLLNAGILIVTPLILYLFIPFYRRLNVTTAYEYLEQRFNAAIRVFCSVAFILFQIGRMGIVLYLPAIALNVVTGFDIFLCIGLMGILSLVYTLLGGIEAVVWTDALQVVVLLGGAITVLCIASFHIPDGLAGVISEGISHDKFNLGSLHFDWKQSTLWTVLIATFFTNLTTYGTDQTMVQRYMTTESARQARKSVLTNAVLTIPASLLFFFAGTVLFVYYRHNPTDLSLTISDADAILPWYIYSQLPQGVVGLLISGIFAAAMSTLSSSMNSAATAYVIDIHSKCSRSKAPSLRVAKWMTFLLGAAGILFAYLMATWEIKSLWDEFNRILGIILGSLGGLFLLGMMTTKANSAGAFCGLAGSILIQLLVVRFQAVHLLLYTATGFTSCFIIGYLASWILPDDKKSIAHLTIYKIFSKQA